MSPQRQRHVTGPYAGCQRYICWWRREQETHHVKKKKKGDRIVGYKSLNKSVGEMWPPTSLGSGPCSHCTLDASSWLLTPRCADRALGSNVTPCDGWGTCDDDNKWTARQSWSYIRRGAERADRLGESSLREAKEGSPEDQGAYYFDVVLIWGQAGPVFDDDTNLMYTASIHSLP